IAFNGMTGKLQPVATREADNRPVPLSSGNDGPRGSNECEGHADKVQRLINAIAMSRQVILQKGAQHDTISLTKSSEKSGPLFPGAQRSIITAVRIIRF